MALIYGAGKGGQLVLQELLQNTQLGIRPIGFIDDDLVLRGRSVNRIPVLGSSGDLVSICESHPVSSIVISSDKINGDRLDRILNVCRERNIMVLHGRLQFEPVESNGSLASNIHSIHDEDVSRLVRPADSGGCIGTIERLCEMVPTYTPHRGREALGVRGEEIGGKEKRFSERRNGL